MILPLIFAAVAFATLLVIIRPLLRGAHGTVPREQYDHAVYRDQLRELDRDLARSLLSEAEAQGARLEIQRRLLAVGADPPNRAVRLTRSPVLAAVVVLLVAGGSVGLYSVLGAPALPDMPFVSRNIQDGTRRAAGRADLQQAAARLEEKLRSDPSDVDGWVLYARTTSMLGQWDKAADGYRHAMERGAKGPDVSAGYGEVLVMQAQGIVTSAAHTEFDSALQADPKNDASRYYLALAAGQAGEPRRAIDLLQSLLADIPEDSPVRAEIGRRIGEAAKAAGVPMPELAQGKPAPGPDASARVGTPPGMPTGMSEADRKTMISGMVAKLAAQLKAEPNNPDGWIRLGRAYVVLGERDKAAEAYDHAVILKPGDVAIRMRAVEGLLEGLQPADPLPPQAVALLRQAQAAAPDEPEVLWYLGIVAVRDAHPDDARRYWARLLGKLPTDGEDAKIVKAAMDALNGG